MTHPGLSRVDLTVDQCLNWIRKELFRVEGYIFGKPC